MLANTEEKRNFCKLFDKIGQKEVSEYAGQFPIKSVSGTIDIEWWSYWEYPNFRQLESSWDCSMISHSSTKRTKGIRIEREFYKSKFKIRWIILKWKLHQHSAAWCLGLSHVLQEKLHPVLSTLLGTLQCRGQPLWSMTVCHDALRGCFAAHQTSSQLTSGIACQPLVVIMWTHIWFSSFRLFMSTGFLYEDAGDLVLDARDSKINIRIFVAKRRVSGPRTNI